MSESGYSSDEDCFYREELIRLKKTYRVKALLQKAAHGDIFLGSDRQRRQVILKVIKKRKGSITYHNGRRIPTEAKMHYLAHAADPKGTVALLDVFERTADFVLAMEKPDNSIDLLDFVNEYGQLDLAVVKDITSQLARSTLNHGHIVHRDLKDENVLFDPLTRQTKIIDFGNACYAQDPNVNKFGTPAFYSPEQRTGQTTNTEKNTIYSIGCIAFILLTASSPFTEDVEFDFDRHILLNFSLSKGEREFLSKLLHPNPVQRVQLSTLL